MMMEEDIVDITGNNDPNYEISSFYENDNKMTHILSASEIVGAVPNSKMDKSLNDSMKDGENIDMMANDFISHEIASFHNENDLMTQDISTLSVVVPGNNTGLIDDENPSFRESLSNKTQESSEAIATVPKHDSASESQSPDDDDSLLHDENPSKMTQESSEVPLNDSDKEFQTPRDGSDSDNDDQTENLDGGLSPQDGGSDLMAVLNLRAYGKGNDDIDQTDHRGWEDIAFATDGEETNENPRLEDDETEEEDKNVLRAVARWWKNTKATDPNQPNNPSQMLPSKGVINSILSPTGSAKEKGTASKQDMGTDSDRKPAPRWWWRGKEIEYESSHQRQEDDTSRQKVEATANNSDTGSAVLDYDEIGAEMFGSALDWLQSDDHQQAMDEVEVISVGSDLASLGDDPVDDLPAASFTRSPEQRSADLEKVVQWMRKGKGKGRKREDKYDPTGEFRKLEDMLPKRKGITPEERAIEIEDALDWLRKYYQEDEAPSAAGVEDETTQTSTPKDDIDWSNLEPAPVCITNPDDRLRELENIMMWIRNKGLGMGSKYDPNGTFRKLNKLLPRKKGLTLEDRGREIEGVLDWMRNSGIIPLKATEIVLPDETSKLEQIRISRRSPEQRAKDLKDVLLWMSHDGEDEDKNLDPNGYFRRLNLILEAEEGQSNEDRAKEIECSLDWLLQNDSDGSVPSSPGGRHRRAPRGGRRRKRRTPSPGKKKSAQARVPKLITSPREAQPNLFASIGRVVNVVAPPPPSDVSSTAGVTAIPDANDVLLDIAQQHTIEVANAIAYLVEPEAPPAEEIKEVDTDIFGGANENWWESGDSVNATKSC